MKKRTRHDTIIEVLVTIIGVLLPLVIWVSVKDGLHISNRYLPGPRAVIRAFSEIEPSIWSHTFATMMRLLRGGVAGAGFGIAIGIAMYYSPYFSRMVTPTIQSLRSIPSVATVPFFLLWFGFSEKGKYLLIVLAVGLNVGVAAYQILDEMPYKYRIALNSFGHSSRRFPLRVSLPLVFEGILPALRTSLAIAFGAVVVAEMLGSQLGLGYLIQTSRTTYSLHVVFLATIALGILNVVVDQCLVLVWKVLVFWRYDLIGRLFTLGTKLLARWRPDFQRGGHA
jgi:ABC-type nitrate/sulfonate/bicarbonate transport system permease component